MILTNAELIDALKNEVRLLLHLASKVEPGMLDFRPTAKQRSVLELLRYLTIVGPIHLDAALWERFDMEAWKGAWTAREEASKELTLADAKESIAKLAGLFEETLKPLSGEDLRAEIELFGHKASRGSWIVNLVLSHYTAYRMQLFLYLKSAGREELNTMNLWVGMDGRM